jgi:hypothetical protein
VIEMIKYVLCTVGGAAMGYFAATIVLEKKFERKLLQEEEELRAFYLKRYEDQAVKDGENPDLVNSAVSAAEAIRKYDGIDIPPAVLKSEMTATVQRAVERGDLDVEETETDEPEPPAEPKPARQKVPPPPRINYQAISTKPKAEKEPEQEEPQIPEEDDEDEVQVDKITKEQFVADEFSYKQMTFEYYVVDDVLVNESDEIVTAHLRDTAVGKGTLEALAAGDEDVIYVRNHNGKWDMEIIKQQSKYADEVSTG